MPKIRLIALDLDGTLLDSSLAIPRENRAALARAAAEGIRIVLASGRMTSCMEKFADQADLDGPVISYNGAMVRGARSAGRPLIFSRPLPSPAADDLVDLCAARRLFLNYYLDDALYAVDDPRLRRFADLYADRTGAVYRLVGSLAPFKGGEPSKLLIVADPPARDGLYDELAPAWRERGTLLKTNPEYLEFLNRRTDKGEALAALARHLGIRREQVAAVGDGDNDASMLRAAGVGVALANATAAAKAASERVTHSDHDHGGAAEAIEFLLGA